MSVLRDQHASGYSEWPGVAAINDMKAKEIKGFPPPLRSRSLNRQHNFANMFAGLHPPVRVGGLFQRECAVHQGFSASSAQQRLALGLVGRAHRALTRITTGPQRRAGVVSS